MIFKLARSILSGGRRVDVTEGKITVLPAVEGGVVNRSHNFGQKRVLQLHCTTPRSAQAMGLRGNALRFLSWAAIAVLLITLLTACDSTSSSNAPSNTIAPTANTEQPSQYGGDDPLGTATVLEAVRKAEMVQLEAIKKAESQRLQRVADQRATATAQVRDAEMQATSVALSAVSTRVAVEMQATAQANQAQATAQALETQRQAQEIGAKQTASAVDLQQRQMALVTQATATAQAREDERRQQQIDVARAEDFYDSVWAGLRVILTAIGIGIVAMAVILPGRKAVVKMWADWQAGRTQRARIAAATHYNADVLPASTTTSTSTLKTSEVTEISDVYTASARLRALSDQDIVTHWEPPLGWATANHLPTGDKGAMEDLQI